MSSVTLPAIGYVSARPFYVDYGATMKSALGGKTQRVNRLGNRFGLEVQLPVMRSGEAALALIATLNMALQNGLICPFPQVGFAVGTPGSMLVNGGNQAGMALNVDGGSAGYVARAGQMFNVTVSGRLYLYQMRENLTLSGAGAGALPILPELRKSPADNAAVDFATPKIEGFLEGDGRDWTIDRARTIGLGFTLVEAA